jgi:hypothetical protein
LQLEAGIPEIAGAVVSILMVIGTERDNPTPFVAVHVTVAPAVSAVRVVVSQPLDSAMPDSKSPNGEWRYARC